MLRRHAVIIVAVVAVLGWLAPEARAFCGFYVAKADTKLFNKASKVVIARHDGKTVISMVNDYQGDPKEFAMVIPVPQVLERGQIHVTENAIIDHLDAYTAPRLVEYFDGDPCTRFLAESVAGATARLAAVPSATAKRATSLGVTIEAEYTVGEYDILILSAEQSTGLRTWLTENGYKLPDGVVQILDTYLAKGMKFFVAKVNLAAKTELGYTYLRPLQIAFESPHFMLPIRLGMVNADGPQELFVMTLTRRGRVEAANYRNVFIKSDQQIPIFVKGEFNDFYRAMFDRQVEIEDGRAVFLEYAWDMGWCDPCAADPLSAAELRELGVFWLDDIRIQVGQSQTILPTQPRDVFVTRLHLRYDSSTFPDDLMFRETEKRQNYQGRFILRHPWKVTQPRCQAEIDYAKRLPKRFDAEAQTLAALTNWPISEIRAKMEAGGQSFEVPRLDAPGDKKWWEKLWQDDKG